MCGGMKFMNPTLEAQKRNICICNYGTCESDVSITVSLDELNILINAIRNDLDNALYRRKIHFANRDTYTLDDYDVSEPGKEIFNLTRLLTNLEKLRQQ